MKKLSSIVFAGALLLGACSTTRTDTVADVTTDDYGQVRAEASATTASVPITGPAKVDSEGRVYTSSAAPGSGNASSLGTNTNVNIIPEEPRASVTIAQTNLITEPAPEPVDNEALVTESTAMISSANDEATTQVEPATTDQSTTTTTKSTTRTRMRKD